MRRAATMTFALALPGLLMGAIWAQEYDSATGTSIVIGCLQASESGGFTLVGTVSVEEGAEPGEKTAYDIRGVIPPGVRLSSHVGHQVEVTGAIVDASEPDERPQMHMHAFEHLAAECG